jgi:predicted flavoprotein YhiN
MLLAECADGDVTAGSPAASRKWCMRPRWRMRSQTPRARAAIRSTRTVAWCAPRLVLATGGLSIPKIGATDFGYRLAQQFSCR